jgi:hypothetical protein
MGDLALVGLAHPDRAAWRLDNSPVQASRVSWAPAALSTLSRIVNAGPTIARSGLIGRELGGGVKSFKPIARIWSCMTPV